MHFPTALKMLPLLLLVACESKRIEHEVVPPMPAMADAPAKPPVEATLPLPADSTHVFVWQDETCSNTGTFPTKAYTQRQLRDTYRLASSFTLLTTVAAFDFQHYNDAHFRQAARHLTHEYDSLTAVLNKLEVVPTPYWRNLKRLRRLELAEQYALDTTQLRGYFQPASWVTNRYYSHCAEYARALASPDTAEVIKAWRKLVDAQKANNGDPERLEQEYQRESAAPGGIRYAKMQLMTFGWGNCANELSKYNALDDQGMASPLNKFNQLFTHIEQANCVDVD